VTKHSSLLQKFLNYWQKRFSTFVPGANAIITFFARNLQFFCNQLVFVRLGLKKLAMDKHSSLLKNHKLQTKKVL
jgi:hypothetical protein